MGQVADVSRQYAAGSKQAAAAATELNSLAGDLRASIAQFKASEGDQRAPDPVRDTGVTVTVEESRTRYRRLRPVLEAQRGRDDHAALGPGRSASWR